MRRRMRLAWHVLRGRPLCYRMEIRDGVLFLPYKGIVVESAFIGRTGWRDSNTGTERDS